MYTKKGQNFPDLKPVQFHRQTPSGIVVNVNSLEILLLSTERRVDDVSFPPAFLRGTRAVYPQCFEHLLLIYGVEI